MIRAIDGIQYIGVDGYIIYISFKEDMMTIRIPKPTDKELWTCTTIELTSDLPWNIEETSKKDLTTKEYDDLVSHAKDGNREYKRIKIEKNILQARYLHMSFICSNFQ